MAHVGAVRQVVGAEAAHHQLVAERGLVAGAPGGVERGRIRRRQRPQLGGDHRERVVPGDLLVGGGAGALHDGVGEPALLPEPVLAAAVEVGEGVRREELRPEAAGGGLLGHGLGTVLAELGPARAAVDLAGLGPGATGAVEPVALVEQAQCLDCGGGAHLLDAALERHQDAGQPGRPPLRLADGQIVLVDLAGHAPIVRPRHSSCPAQDDDPRPTRCRAAGSFAVYTTKPTKRATPAMAV